jgi:predicted nucleic acid-binding protein
MHPANWTGCATSGPSDRLDANALIAHLDRRDAHHESATQLLAATGTEPLGASVISLAETLVAPAKAGRLADATAAIAHLGVRELGPGPDAARRLAQLRCETGRKLPDCCVLLAAQENGGTVASFDSALIGAAKGLGLPTL